MYSIHGQVYLKLDIVKLNAFKMNSHFKYYQEIWLQKQNTMQLYFLRLLISARISQKKKPRIKCINIHSKTNCNDMRLFRAI